MFLLLISGLLFSSLIYIIEGHDQPEVFPSIPAAMHWFVITIISGWGNVDPVTFPGVILVIVTQILAIALAAILTGVVSTAYTTQVSRREAIYEMEIRAVLADGVVTELHGTLRVDGGLDAFADPDLLKAVGATPYADDIESAGVKPSDAVTVAFTAELPGAKKASFSVPLDGASADLATTGRLVAGGASNWGVASTVLLVALVAWCLAAAGFVAWVAQQRRLRRNRPQP